MIVTTEGGTRVSLSFPQTCPLPRVSDADVQTELKYSAHSVLSSSNGNRSYVCKQLQTAHLDVLMMCQSHSWFLLLGFLLTKAH